MTDIFLSFQIGLFCSLSPPGLPPETHMLIPTCSASTKNDEVDRVCRATRLCSFFFFFFFSECEVQLSGDLNLSTLPCFQNIPQNIFQVVNFSLGDSLYKQNIL